MLLKHDDWATHEKARLSTAVLNRTLGCSDIALKRSLCIMMQAHNRHFTLILRTPLVILNPQTPPSDMGFGSRLANFNTAKSSFAAAGSELPAGHLCGNIQRQLQG